MAKQNDQAPIASENDAKEQQSGGVAVLEKPKVLFEDDDPVTVLHGWGRVRPGEKHYIDKVLFEDGIARNVPYRIVKYWQKGTRPDGKSEQVYGKVQLQAVLPNDATEADFCKATGITPMPAQKFAAMLAGVDLDEVVKHLGVEKVKALIAGLEQRVPKQPR